jgi:hypothetical protein
MDSIIHSVPHLRPITDDPTPSAGLWGLFGTSSKKCSVLTPLSMFSRTGAPRDADESRTGGVPPVHHPEKKPSGFSLSIQAYYKDICVGYSLIYWIFIAPARYISLPA